MIKLEYLRVFVTVAEPQALNEAAERLGRTPSAVSMTLKQIEESLGGPLFEGERKAALTPLGAFALRHARRAVSEHDTATAAIQRFARGNTLLLQDEGRFRDTSEEAGVTMGRWAWGSNFLDINNDGFEDIVVANGFVSSYDTKDL